MSRGQVHLLATSPRVAPGLLSVDAWDALRAGPVLVADGAHPQLPALVAAGVAVEVVDVAVLGASGTVALLLDRAADTGHVTWLATDGEQGLATALGARTGSVDLEVLAGSWDLPGARLLDAVAVMDRLRSPGGCPWDAEQTHASLAPYLLEEAYEAHQEIVDGRLGAALRDELGDVLLQVLFHARLAEEAAGGWSVDDVAAGLVAKLIRRHPHVFADTYVDGAAAVEANWDAIKAAEGQRHSVVDGVAMGQPALSLAAKLVGRAEKAGLATGLDKARDARPDELLGRALFGLAASARRQGIDPEAALRTVAREFADRLRRTERPR